MFRRFVAASSVGALVIALGALVVLLLAPDPRKIYILTAAWCFVPLVWGLWAMFAPLEWVPRRLPVWGAILGVIAGVMAGFVLDLPSLFAGQPVSAGLRSIAILAGPAAYYLLWLLVRTAYQSLAVASDPTGTARS
jgi:hypothetical protein